MGAVAIGGVILALVLPNRLNWKSDSPYLDSVRGVVAYNSGSGAGRLVQYRNTLHMAEAHPILGVGPGNWPVYYPKFATHNDPSLSQNNGTTANPWPSSDWATLISERGILAVVSLLLAFVGMIANAFQSTRGSSANNPGARDPFLPVAVTAAVLITGAVGAFDAVAILAAPTFIVWAALGALVAPGRSRMEWSPSPGRSRLLGLLAAAVLLIFSVRATGATVAMQAFGNGQRLSSVQHASVLDPGSYRIQLRLAILALNSHGCAMATPYARRAARMLPSAGAPRRLLERCSS